MSRYPGSESAGLALSCEFDDLSDPSYTVCGFTADLQYPPKPEGIRLIPADPWPKEWASAKAQPKKGAKMEKLANVVQTRRIIGLGVIALLAGLLCLISLSVGQDAISASESAGIGSSGLSAGSAETVAGPSLACCGDLAHRPSGVAAGTTFTFAQASDPATLDPALAEDGDSLMVTSQLYETLVAYEEGGTIPLPGLAQSWTVSQDGLTWTFNLRSGVTFHDGSVLDADAVAYNLERWWDPAHPYHNGGFVYFEILFGGFKGDPGCLLHNVSTAGTDQVLLTLSEPHSSFPSILAFGAFAIASPLAIQTGELGTNPVGSGPFKFVEWLPGQHVELAANPTYWGEQPLLQDLVFVPIGDDGERLAALQADLVQGTTVSSSYVPTARLDSNLKVLWRPSLNVGYLGINRGRGPLAQPLVDQAIAYAIDRSSLIDQHYNVDADSAQVASQLVPPVVWGHKDDLVDYPYDPVQARLLLEQAGYPNGFTTTLWLRNVVRSYLPDPVGVAQAIQADLADVGISATVIVTDSSIFLGKVYAGEADLFLLGWMADYPHPENFLSPILCDTYLAYGPRDGVLCDQLDAAQGIFDFDTLLGIYRWANQRVHDTLPVVPIAHVRNALILRRNVVGLTPSPLGLELFADVFFAGSGADAWVEVVPDAAATLVYTDAQGGSAVIEVPAGAVAETVTLVYTFLERPTEPSVLPFAGHAFRLEAYRNGELIPGFAFAEPVTVTIHYPQADLICLNENTLELRYWDGVSWATDGISLVERDTGNNRLVVTVAHLSQFATFAEERECVHLPLVLRSAP
jgi:peptide/nickel transport system substrate-binding protein